MNLSLAGHIERGLFILSSHKTTIILFCTSVNSFTFYCADKTLGSDIMQPQVLYVWIPIASKLLKYALKMTANWIFCWIKVMYNKYHPMNCFWGYTFSDQYLQAYVFMNSKCAWCLCLLLLGEVNLTDLCKALITHHRELLVPNIIIYDVMFRKKRICDKADKW